MRRVFILEVDTPASKVDLSMLLSYDNKEGGTLSVTSKTSESVSLRLGHDVPEGDPRRNGTILVRRDPVILTDKETWSVDMPPEPPDRLTEKLHRCIGCGISALQPMPHTCDGGGISPGWEPA